MYFYENVIFSLLMPFLSLSAINAGKMIEIKAI